MKSDVEVGSSYSVWVTAVNGAGEGDRSKVHQIAVTSGIGKKWEPKPDPNGYLARFCQNLAEFCKTIHRLARISARSCRITIFLSDLAR